MKQRHMDKSRTTARNAICFTPDRLIIDGTERTIVSRSNPSGNGTYYEIFVGCQNVSILLPPRLFFLVGCLAMLRDFGTGTSSDSDEDRGFVHRERLSLSRDTINTYVYCVKKEIHRQLTDALLSDCVSLEQRNELMPWPVIESGASYGRTSHWRLAIPPASISVNLRVLEFPDATLREIGNNYFQRHPVLSPHK